MGLRAAALLRPAGERHSKEPVVRGTEAGGPALELPASGLMNCLGRLFTKGASVPIALGKCIPFVLSSHKAYSCTWETLSFFLFNTNKMNSFYLQSVLYCHN